MNVLIYVMILNLWKDKEIPSIPYGFRVLEVAPPLHLFFSVGGRVLFLTPPMHRSRTNM